jgi:hypothetical protein
MPCCNVLGRTYTLDVLNFSAEAFTFTRLREEVFSTENMLAAIGDCWKADICEDIEGLPA